MLEDVEEELLDGFEEELSGFEEELLDGFEEELLDGFEEELPDGLLDELPVPLEEDELAPPWFPASVPGPALEDGAEELFWSEVPASSALWPHPNSFSSQLDLEELELVSTADELFSASGTADEPVKDSARELPSSRSSAEGCRKRENTHRMQQTHKPAAPAPASNTRLVRTGICQPKTRSGIAARQTAPAVW